jgi:AraC-like DNA-binding protein
MKIDIQKAIDWIEGKLEDEVSLKEISEFIRYSPSHTSREFKRYMGSTLRNYIQLRRLTKAAIELRDKQVRIIDIAIKYGYNSQEAFSRSFKEVFSITPREYIKTKRMIPYVFKKDVLYPEYIRKEGEVIMVKDEEIKVSVEVMPEHKFVYLEKEGVDNYMSFWEQQEREGKDCDLLHGLLASIPGVFNEGYGAFTKEGYIFGKDAAVDYYVEEKHGFKELIIPEQKYLKFEHPGFTESEFGQALNQVRRIALKDFNMEIKNFQVDDSFVRAYEHSGMELLYYFIRIPLKRY